MPKCKKKGSNKPYDKSQSNVQTTEKKNKELKSNMQATQSAL